MSTKWSAFTKSVVTVILLIAAAWLLVRFDALLAPLVIALLLAYLLNRPVNMLARRTGLNRTLATLLVFLALVVFLVALPILFGRPVFSLISRVQLDLRAVQQALDRFFSQPVVIFDVRLEPQGLYDQAIATIGDLMSPLATSALGAMAGAAQALGWLLFVLVVAFLLVKDIHYFARVISERIPVTLAPDFYRLVTELGDIWDAYLRGQLLAAIATGSLIALSLRILGLPGALGLGFLAGLLNFVPHIGSVLAAIPAVLVAWVSGSSYLPLGSLGMALLVVAVYVVIAQIENLYLRPVIVGGRVRLHPVVIIVGTVAGALVAGILGILLAAPVIASARVLLGYIFRKLADKEPFEPPQESPQTLGVEWRGLIRGHAISAVLFDLDGTLLETDDRAVEVVAQRLDRFRILLPQGDSMRAARRLIMHSDNLWNRWWSLMDGLHLNGPAQRLTQTVGLIQQAGDVQGLEPVEGVIPLLRDLSGRYQLGIVSSRGEAELQAFLEQHGLNGQVEIVVGGDSVEHIKPHPQPVLWAAEHLGVAPEQVALVGDTAADMQAAKAAGAVAVGVLCGFGERTDLEQADLILESTAELAEWL